MGQVAASRSNAVSIAKVKKGIVITVATLGSIAFIFICALLMYRRKLKRQQTVYPASHNAFADGCWNAEDSDSDDTDCSD